MIYDKLLSVYIANLGRFETDVITATNNVIKSDFCEHTIVELIRAKAIEQWHRDFFKDILDYVKVLERMD